MAFAYKNLDYDETSSRTASINDRAKFEGHDEFQVVLAAVCAGRAFQIRVFMKELVERESSEEVLRRCTKRRGVQLGRSLADSEPSEA